MAKGLYLSIGLNSVDPVAYQGWSGMLIPCENDARDVAAIAESKGCKGKTLLTADATSINVLRELQAAADQLVTGDLFVLYYSGHGSNVGDATADEEDGLDETWCLFDRMLVDDELYALWSRFAPGVRVLVLSDSCNSGTVIKKLGYAASAETSVVKSLPLDKAWPIYLENKTWYDGVQLVAGKAGAAGIRASLLLISGCQDNQLSLAGDPNSFFTEKLKYVWKGGKFSGGYRGFHSAILALMPPTQSPNYFTVGAVNLEFEAQVPFTV